MSAPSNIGTYTYSSCKGGELAFGLERIVTLTSKLGHRRGICEADRQVAGLQRWQGSENGRIKGMKASDIMTLGAATVTPESSLAMAIRCLGDHGISALPVVDRDGKLQGIISEGDFFRKATGAFQLDSLCGVGREARRDVLDLARVGDLMSIEPVTVDGDASLTEAIGLMERHGVKRLPVISNGKLVGLISRADILRTLLEE